jgi:hypothetical protein
MKNRDVIVGVVLVALIAAGVFFVRSRSAPTEVPAGQAAGGSPEPTTTDDALPDATTADATAEIGGLRLTLSLTPKPPVVLEAFQARVRAEADGMPVALENGRISFEMVMPMGDHRYSLVSGDDGWHEAAVVLPT